MKKSKTQLNDPAAKLRFLLTLCAGVILAFFSAGCAVGPDYTRPAMDIPADFKESPAYKAELGRWSMAEPSLADQGPWWKMYQDPLLDELIGKIDISNQDLQAAEARIRQAQAQVRESRAGLFPSLDTSGQVDRTKSFQGEGISNTYNLKANMSWEIDLWGATRRGVEASIAEARSIEADAAALRLSLQTELAADYFQLRSLDEQLALYEETIGIYEKALALTENKYNAGVVTRADVAQARTQLESARVSAVDLGLQRRQLEHAIAILLGVAPAQFSLERQAFNATLPDLPPGLPAQLLERRPDVASAEQKVIAANANIGVAKSAWFPNVTFSAGAGLQHWFNAPERMWSLGPLGLVLNIFDGGATMARSDQAWAAWEASAADYRQTVLTAFKEVEDCLAGHSMISEETRLQARATMSARESETLAMNQYYAGTVDYLNVVSAQTIALNNSMNSEDLRGRLFINSVQLIKALGGGWDNKKLTN